MTDRYAEKQKDFVSTSTPLTLSIQKEDEAVNGSSDICEYDQTTQRLLDILDGKVKIESVYTEEEKRELLDRT